jgi:hypothetical protein
LRPRREPAVSQGRDSRGSRSSVRGCFCVMRQHSAKSSDRLVFRRRRARARDQWPVPYRHERPLGIVFATPNPVSLDSFSLERRRTSSTLRCGGPRSRVGPPRHGSAIEANVADSRAWHPGWRRGQSHRSVPGAGRYLRVATVRAKRVGVRAVPDESPMPHLLRDRPLRVITQACTWPGPIPAPLKLTLLKLMTHLVAWSTTALVRLPAFVSEVRTRAFPRRLDSTNFANRAEGTTLYRL